jgi:hypothetical protein
MLHPAGITQHSSMRGIEQGSWFTLLLPLLLLLLLQVQNTSHCCVQHQRATW